MALAVVGAMAAGSSCTSSNPAYEGGDPPGGSTTDVAGTTLGASDDGAGSTQAEGSATGDDSTGDGSGSDSSDTEGVGICGDGRLDEGESCDDGNTVDGDGCDSSCRAAGDVVWSVEFGPTGTAEDRFHDLVLLDGDPLAVGRAVLEGGQPHQAVLMGYDAEDGSPILEAALDGDWPSSEAFGVTLSPNRVYVGGSGLTAEGSIAAFAAAFDRPRPGDPLVKVWDASLPGAVSRGLAFRGGELLVTLSELADGGYGLAALDSDGGVSWSWVETILSQPSQFETIVHLEDAPVVGGMLAGNAIVAGVGSSVEMTSPWLMVEGAGLGSSRVQAAVPLETEVIAGGWLDQAGTQRDAWLGRYRLDGSEVWSVVVDGGSSDGDEIESVALDGLGHVIAVGMLGTPAVPVVWTIDVASGEVRRMRPYPELGPGAASFRAVAVDGGIFVAGERRTGGGSVGIVARLVP